MKLVILNGSPASGKSTAIEKLHRALPMSLLIEGDVWRRFINGWRENREESLRLAYKIVVAAVDAYLETGHDVLIDKAILGQNGVLDALEASGKRNGAEIYEFILSADKDTIIKRAQARGFRENGLLTPERVEELWHMAEETRLTRPSAIVIDTANLDAEAVYQKIKETIFK